MATLTNATTFRYFADCKNHNSAISNRIANNTNRIGYVFSFATDAKSDLQALGAEYGTYVAELNAEVAYMEANAADPNNVAATYPDYPNYKGVQEELRSFVAQYQAELSFINSVITALETYYPR